MTIVEPLREFYKDEVREIARSLGIKSSEATIPRPGSSRQGTRRSHHGTCRFMQGSVPYSGESHQRVSGQGECDLPWQYFATLLPVKSVGVHGDVRVHGETVVVRAVASLDGMSARYSPLPHGLLAEISTITNSLKGHVNRVVYDITHKPPGTIEWE